MISKVLNKFIIIFILTISRVSQAALFISDPAQFGTRLNTTSSCDDCFEAISFSGTGHSINFFGTNYSGGFVSSNGLINFGSSGYNSWEPTRIDVQSDRPMIAGYWTDLVPSTDLGEGVFVNDATPGQLVVTWIKRTHYQNSAPRSTFQLVIRSSQFSLNTGEGQIGFFYDAITDTATGNAGLGDGLGAANPGEVSFHNGPGTELSNASPRWFSLGVNGVPIETSSAPIPTLSEWAMIFLVSLMAILGVRRMRHK